MPVPTKSLLLTLGFMAAASSAQPRPGSPPTPQTETQAEEIVVTARRSGVPVWRVTSPRTTIILVGGIEGVAKTSRWNPAPLTEALVKSDRVMFPDTVGVAGSPLALIGYVAKWRKQASLPKGQSLAGMMSAKDYARLVALRKRGVLKAGFETTHPFHLALSLRNAAKGQVRYGQDASQFARKAAKAHKIKVVPLARGKAKVLANEIFTSRPQSHLPCLMDAVALIEAGPGAVQARSDAWAQRRVVDVVNSPAEQVYRSCWPAGSKLDITSSGLSAQVRRLLNEPQLTFAVVSLASLASPGGVLDDLQAAGFNVRGPRWKS